MTIRHYGVEGYRKLLRQGISCAERLAERVHASDEFERLHEPNLYIYSFRYAPLEDRELAQRSERDRERVDAKLDRLNQHISDEIKPVASPS